MYLPCSDNCLAAHLLHARLHTYFRQSGNLVSGELVGSEEDLQVQNDLSSCLKGSCIRATYDLCELLAYSGWQYRGVLRGYLI